MAHRRARANLACRTEERWAPPPLARSTGVVSRSANRVRRFFDLQAGSIWQDISDVLNRARGKVVDVGCGGQPYRSLLPPDVEYVGIDITEAKEHFGYASPDTVYFSGQTWPDAATDADVVLCTEALEHVLEPADFLREAFRCLRPGGLLLLTVPFAARWHFVPYDYWRFTPSSLSHLLERAGFERIEVFARGNALTVACYKLMALLLPLLAPQGKGQAATLALRALGAGSLPTFLVLAAVGNLSLRGQGGDDCLGYTVLATRPPDRVGAHRDA